MNQADLLTTGPQNKYPQWMLIQKQDGAVSAQKVCSRRGGLALEATTWAHMLSVRAVPLISVIRLFAAVWSCELS